MNSFNIHWTSSRIFCVDFQETGLKYTFPATRFRYAHASSRLSASIRRCFRFYTMLGNLVETIKTRSRTRNAMFYVLYVLYISCWTKIYISKKEKKNSHKKSFFRRKNTEERITRSCRVPYCFYDMGEETGGSWKTSIPSDRGIGPVVGCCQLVSIVRSCAVMNL